MSSAPPEAIATVGPELPLPYGANPYAAPLETLTWTAPTWFLPTVPVPERQTPQGATQLVPIISMMPVHKGPGNYVRAFDALPDQGYPLLTPSNPPVPFETIGGGLRAPLSPAPGEYAWTKYPQYAAYAPPSRRP